MAARSTTRFGSVIVRATRSSASSTTPIPPLSSSTDAVTKAPSPSSSDSILSDPPDDTDDDESKYFRPSKQTRTVIVPLSPSKHSLKKGKAKEEAKIKPEPVEEMRFPKMEPEEEPPPSMGDIPELKLPPAPPKKKAAKKAAKGKGKAKVKQEQVKQEPTIKPEIKPEIEPDLKDPRITELKSESDPAASHPAVKDESKIQYSPTPLPGPKNWERIYALVKQMRLSGKHQAAVDTMGCERLALLSAPPIVQRFQTLISLMLSSQTKDTVTAVVIRNLQTSLPGGLTLESILALEAPKLNELIRTVGFHTRKTGYIKAAALICHDQHSGDIPNTLDGLMALPGVGPKMAHLCMGAAWNNTTGIGVDVHVHRITNMWGWVDTKDPEGTRKQLESWLPRERWREINWLLVGFGQSICLPRGRKCGECELGVGEGKGLCRAAFKANADGTGGGKGGGGTKVRKRVVKEEESTSSEGEGDGGSEEDYKPEKKKKGKTKAAARRVRRKVIKEEVPVVKGEQEVVGCDIEDIEDVMK